VGLRTCFFLFFVFCFFVFLFLFLFFVLFVCFVFVLFVPLFPFTIETTTIMVPYTANLHTLMVLVSIVVGAQHWRTLGLNGTTLLPLPPCLLV
jgi:hypothetical protein